MSQISAKSETSSNQNSLRIKNSEDLSKRVLTLNAETKEVTLKDILDRRVIKPVTQDLKPIQDLVDQGILTEKIAEAFKADKYVAGAAALLTHLTDPELQKTFSPGNWKNVSKTLYNENIGSYYKGGRLTLDLILQLANHPDRENIIGNIDSVVEALGLNLSNLSIKQIHDFFTAKKTPEQKAELITKGLTKGIDIAFLLIDLYQKQGGSDKNCCIIV